MTDFSAAPDAAGIEAALTAGVESIAQQILNTVDPLLPGHEVRMACVQIVRAHVAAALLPVVTPAQAAERERVAQAIEDATLDATFLSDSEARGWWKGNAEAARIARADESGA